MSTVKGRTFRLLAIVLGAAVLWTVAASLVFPPRAAEASDCTLSHSITYYYSADGGVYIRTNHSSRCSSGISRVHGWNVVNSGTGLSCYGASSGAGVTSSCSTSYVRYPSSRQNYVTAYTEAQKYNTVTKTWAWHQGPKVCNWTVDRPGTAPEVGQIFSSKSESCSE